MSSPIHDQASPAHTATPYQFERTHSLDDVVKTFDDKVASGESLDDVVRVTGRVMLRREQGKLAFMTLRDATGDLQLFARANRTERFDELCSTVLGTWIGVSGNVMRTKKGELSIDVVEWEVLAIAKRQFPDKFHGLTDTDLRYRQRYVDLWVTKESRETLVARSRIVSELRRWLEARDFIEVETPILQTLAGGASARPFVTHHNALDVEMFMRIAPELYLKRLVVGGFERVFEIARNFRNEGIDTTHSPEFTMIEWYEAFVDFERVMERSEQMVADVCTALHGTTTITVDGRELDLSTPWRRVSMTELASKATGVDLDIHDDVMMRKVANDVLDKIEPEWGTGKLLLEIFEATAESQLWSPTFVTEHPKEISPLARDHRTKPGMTERFEAFVCGSELINGFSELNDSAEQLTRFEEQAQKKAAGDEEAMEVDRDYIRAMEYGLPPTGGAGMGVDRLVMLLTDNDSIRDVLLFPTMRPEKGGGE